MASTCPASLFTGVAALLLVSGATLSSQDPQPAGENWKKFDSPAYEAILASESTYVGSASCKMCHNKANTGDSYRCWKESRHASAFETLKGEAAQKLAAELGLKDPTKEPGCLQCHTTGAAFLGDEEKFGKKFKLTEGVGCESCHGPGSGHLAGRKAAKAMKVPADRLPEVPDGELILPDLALCSQCHNLESPTFRAFDPEKMLKAVAHLHPLREQPRLKPPKKEKQGE